MKKLGRKPNETRIKEVHAFIKAFIAERGYSPSLMEILEGTSEVSKSVISAHLHMLRARGLITFEDGKPRTIRLVKETT